MEFKEFSRAARSLARNPLGIIALFIVMIYALASVVLGLAKPAFYANPYHPSVLFMALFPICVLATFAYLVARHHQKLYGPSDYKDPRDFRSTFKVPQSIAGRTGIATSDEAPHLIPSSTENDLDTSYEALVRGGFCLIHEAKVEVPRTAPRTGRFTARVWIEAIHGRPLSDIRSVTYKVWSDFVPDKFRTEDMGSNFDLWLSIYGEFPILALVELKDGSSLHLQRYLDLPTRPRD